MYLYNRGVVPNILVSLPLISPEPLAPSSESSKAIWGRLHWLCAVYQPDLPRAPSHF